VIQNRATAEGSTRRYQINLVNTWLRELDRFDGILVFTTTTPTPSTRPLERRIQHRMEFQAPTATVRQRIWENLFSKAAIPGREDLNCLLSRIASRSAVDGPGWRSLMHSNEPPRWGRSPSRC